MNQELAPLKKSSCPAYSALVHQAVRNPAALALLNILNRAFPLGHPRVKEDRDGWAQGFNELVNELAPPWPPDPVEQLLAQRVAFCWVELAHWDIKASAGHLDEGRARDRSQTRFLQALQALHKIRRTRPAPRGRTITIPIRVRDNNLQLTGPDLDELS